MSPEQIQKKPAATPQEQPLVTGPLPKAPDTEEVLAQIKGALQKAKQTIKPAKKVVEKKSRCGCW